MLTGGRSTLTQFLIEERRHHPEATGDLNALITDVSLACKTIARKVAYGALDGVLGSAGTGNVQGEEQKTLDVLSNNMFLRANEWGGHLAGMVSEELEKPYTLPPEGTDVFRIFTIPIPTDRVRFVRGLEFRPGNPNVVHHANIRVDPTPASRRLDDADPGPGYDGVIARSADYPDGHFLGWTPGQVAPLLPKELSWRLEKNTDLVAELHMQPSGRPETVSPSVGLYFGDVPPTRTPAMLRLGRQNIDIPAGDSHYTPSRPSTAPPPGTEHPMFLLLAM